MLALRLQASLRRIAPTVLSAALSGQGSTLRWPDRGGADGRYVSSASQQGADDGAPGVGGTGGGGGGGEASSALPHQRPSLNHVRHTMHCRALAAFREAKGRMPQHLETWEHDGQQVKLGSWWFTCRAKHKQGTLAQQLQRDIEAAVGPALLSQLWRPLLQMLPPSVMCSALESFAAAKGRLPVQLELWEHEGQQVNLGTWLTNRRMEQKRGQLDEQLRRDIKAVVGPMLAARLWEPLMQICASAMCHALACFATANERMPRAQETWEHEGQQVNLGSWLEIRRAKQKRGQLDEQLRRDIEAAVGPELAARLWEPGKQNLPASVLCDALKSFVAANGCLPKQQDTWEYEGQQVNLGMWLHHRRMEQKRGQLAEQLRVDIEAAVGAQLATHLWERWQPVWAEHHERLVQGLAHFAVVTARLPKARDMWELEGCQVRLGYWLWKRRSQHKKGRLAEKLQQDIEAAVGPALAAGLW